MGTHALCSKGMYCEPYFWSIRMKISTCSNTIVCTTSSRHVSTERSYSARIAISQLWATATRHRINQTRTLVHTSISDSGVKCQPWIDGARFVDESSSYALEYMRHVWIWYYNSLIIGLSLGKNCSLSHTIGHDDIFPNAVCVTIGSLYTCQSENMSRSVLFLKHLYQHTAYSFSIPMNLSVIDSRTMYMNRTFFRDGNLQRITKDITYTQIIKVQLYIYWIVIYGFFLIYKLYNAFQ